MKRLPTAILLLAALALTSPAQAAGGQLVDIVRFTDYETGPVEDWLKEKGFRFEQDAKSRSRIDLNVDETGLVVETRRRALGLMPNEAVNVPDFTEIEIEWGVNRFPEGASYEAGVRNEALMLIVFLGDERQPSGSMFIPDSPHFIGFFLCDGDDRLRHPYVGAYFKKGGRYVCMARPKPGETVKVRFDLMKAYRDYFDREGDDDPAVSGIALAVDTKKASGGGKAEAFIRAIRFFR